MPTIRAVLVIQDRKSRAVVVPDKQIPARDMLEAIRILSQHFVPANKLATVQLATGSWALKTMTDLPVGRANLAILTQKLYPSRKKIALADQIYEVLLEVESWTQADAVEEAHSRQIAAVNTQIELVLLESTLVTSYLFLRQLFLDRLFPKTTPLVRGGCVD